MTIQQFFVRPVTIQHPVLVSSGYGTGTEEDFSTPTVTETRGWLYQLSEQERQSATRDTEFSTHVLRLPKGTPIGAADRVVIDGQTFSVEGVPNRAWTTRGEHHVRAALSLIDG